MRRVIGYSSIAVALGLGLGACQGTVLDVGPDDSGTLQADSGSNQGTSGNGNGGCPAVPGPIAATGDFASLVGTWTGYVESYQFPSGSDAIVLSFSAPSGGSPSGTIVFGQGSPPPPPTDGDAGYSPNGAMGNAIPTSITEGFVYTVLSSSFDGSRLRLGVESREPYSPWCALQTSYSWSANACTFGCLPNWPAMGGASPSATSILDNPDGGPNLVVSTGQFTLCEFPYGVCDCDPTSCTVRLDQPNWTFDMQFTSGHLDGSGVLGTGNNPYNVHLTGP
jgi:hypothetical protein